MHKYVFSLSSIAPLFSLLPEWIGGWIYPVLHHAIFLSAQMSLKFKTCKYLPNRGLEPINRLIQLTFKYAAQFCSQSPKVYLSYQ